MVLAKYIPGRFCKLPTMHLWRKVISMSPGMDAFLLTSE